MNMVDDVRGVGVIKMMMADDVGVGRVKNDRKSDDVICGRPPMKSMDSMELMKPILTTPSTAFHFRKARSKAESLLLDISLLFP